MVVELAGLECLCIFPGTWFYLGLLSKKPCVFPDNGSKSHLRPGLNSHRYLMTCYAPAFQL